MDQLKRAVDPFRHFVGVVQYVFNGRPDFDGMRGVYEGKNQTFVRCDLIRLHGQGALQGDWKIESAATRPNGIILLAREIRFKSGYGMIITDPHGNRLKRIQIPEKALKAMNLSIGFWFGSWGEITKKEQTEQLPVLLAVEAYEDTDRVRFRKCSIARKNDGLHLIEEHLALPGDRYFLKTVYHRSDGTFPALVKAALGEDLDQFTDAVEAALDKVHDPGGDEQSYFIAPTN